WAFENGGGGELFREATRVLDAAHQRDPHNVTGAMMLANAHRMRARAVGVTGAVADAEFQAAERALLDVASAGHAPLVIETHLASVRVDYGFALYEAGRDAEPLLRAGYDRMRDVRARAPTHLKVNRVFALAAWTLADFLVLAGKD